MYCSDFDRTIRNLRNKNGQENISLAVYRDPAGIRTQDPYIKSVMLYQLSYGILLRVRSNEHLAFLHTPDFI